MVGGLLAFAIALIASLILTVPVRALALRVGMVDLPGPRKVHLTPIPLLGGLAIYGGIVLAILFALDGTARAQSTGILAGATLVAVVGILDDRGLRHRQCTEQSFEAAMGAIVVDRQWIDHAAACKGQPVLGLEIGNVVALPE